MTIDEAIELLNKQVRPCDPARCPEAYEAISLGIEALKRVQQLRPNNLYAHSTLLPGETEE